MTTLRVASRSQSVVVPVMLKFLVISESQCSFVLNFTKWTCLWPCNGHHPCKIGSQIKCSALKSMNTSKRTLQSWKIKKKTFFVNLARVVAFLSFERFPNAKSTFLSSWRIPHALRKSKRTPRGSTRLPHAFRKSKRTLRGSTSIPHALIQNEFSEALQGCHSLSGSQHGLSEAQQGCHTLCGKTKWTFRGSTSLPHALRKSKQRPQHAFRIQQGLS